MILTILSNQVTFKFMQNELLISAFQLITLIQGNLTNPV
jgi:hypothetical protein